MQYCEVLDSGGTWHHHRQWTHPGQVMLLHYLLHRARPVRAEYCYALQVPPSFDDLQEMKLCNDVVSSCSEVLPPLLAKLIR